MVVVRLKCRGLREVGSTMDAGIVTFKCLSRRGRALFVEMNASRQVRKIRFQLRREAVSRLSRQFTKIEVACWESRIQLEG